MIMQPLTTKYRPRDFLSVVGQNHIKPMLQQQILTGSTKANYLFFGPRGTGKTSMARIVTKALNCLKNKDGNPCNDCENCNVINKETTLDFVEIDAASHTGVDNIREEIIEKALYHPMQLTKKVYIIDEVHMLSKGAFNALLKIMEEPPEYMTFVLATTEIHKIPDTIISRCQTCQFKKLTIPQITQRLLWIAEQEDIIIHEDAAQLIAKVAEGIMRDAVKYLDQSSVLGDVTVDVIGSFLGIVGEKQVKDFLDVISHQTPHQAVELIEKIQESGVDLQQFVKQILSYINDSFLDDVERMSGLSSLFSSIQSNIKYYPYPVLVYKAKITEYMVHDGNQVRDSLQVISNSRATKSVTSKPVIGSAVDSTNNSEEKQTINKEVVDEKVKKSGIDEKQPTPSVVVPAEGGVYDVDSLKVGLLKLLTSKTLKGSLEKHMIIQSIEEHQVSCVLINKMAEITLGKDTNKIDVENHLSILLGRSIVLKTHFMNKQDYLASLL